MSRIGTPSPTLGSTVFSGPGLVYLTLAGCLLSVYVVLDPANIIESSRAYLRYSGRMGFILLFLSFGAAPLQRLFNNSTTRFLRRNRRYVGIATALVLWAHFLVILSLSFTAPVWFDANAPWFIFYPGSTTFTVVALMALTSNNTAVRLLGAQRWRNLHLIGGYMAVSAFVFEYLLVLYLQPLLLPDYQFETANSPVLAYLGLGLPLVLVLLRFRANAYSSPGGVSPAS